MIQAVPGYKYCYVYVQLALDPPKLLSYPLLRSCCTVCKRSLKLSNIVSNKAATCLYYFDQFSILMISLSDRGSIRSVLHVSLIELPLTMKGQ